MSNNRMFQNAKWIILCRIGKALLQLIVGMITVRYLGPSNYGLVNYANSVIAFMIPVMQLGLNSTLVQEYVTDPDSESKIAGTSMIMSAASSMLCMVGVVGFASVANRGEPVAIWVCALSSLSLLFQATEMLQYWFQAKLKSKYPSLSILVAYAITSGYKLWLLMSGKSVYWFALSNALEYAITSLLFFVAYKYVGGGRLGFSWKIARSMFAKSKYFILSNLMVTIYHNTDLVMVKLISGNAQGGYYGAALTCGCVVNFVYAAIIDSGRPMILEQQKVSKAAFENSMTKLFSVILYATLAQCVTYVLFAPLIVKLLCGEAYLPTVPVLQIVIWHQVFSYTSYVRDIWILAEGKQNVLWIINTSGVVINILLNALMIPHWHAVGAALASVLTYFASNILMVLIVKPLRPSLQLMFRGLNPKHLLSVTKMLKK